MVRLSLVIVISILGAPGLAQEVTEKLPADCGALKITGIFSDLHFEESRQGLVGTEIRIVVTEDGYQASLQFADGRLSNLFVGNVEFDVDLRHWPLGVPLPEREPDADAVEIVIAEGPYAGVFQGKVTKTHLNGTLRLVSGDRKALHLPRGKGYWD